MSSLIELAREVLAPIDAPATFVASRLVGPDLEDGDDDVDEWVALDVAVAARMTAGDRPVLLRTAPMHACSYVHMNIGSYELVVRGPDLQAVEQVVRALDAGAPVRAVLASGDTGIDAYRAAGLLRHRLGTRVPIRVRWDDVLDVKGAALALSFGADELAGPLAPPKQRFKLAQVGGPPEDVRLPSPSYLESLIRAAGRLPVRSGRR